MKALYLLIAVAITFISAAQNAGADATMYDANAKKILDQMSKKYKGYNSMYAQVEFKNENKAAGIDQKSEIKITLSGTKYSITVDSTMILLNDDTTTCSISLEDEEGTMESYEASNSNEEITPSNIWTIYEKGFYYILAEPTTFKGKPAHVIDLAPENKDLDYFKIKMTVNKEDKSIMSMRVLFKDGTHHVYNLELFKANVKVDNSTFKFNSKDYPEVEMEDLRD